MAGRQSGVRINTISRNHLSKIRQSAGGLSLGLGVRIGSWVRVIDCAAGGEGFKYEPLAVPFLHGIGHFHARAWRCAGFGEIFHLRLSRVSIYGDAGKVYIHGAEIYSLQRHQMLANSIADQVVLACYLVAGRQGNYNAEQTYYWSFHQASS